MRAFNAGGNVNQVGELNAAASAAPSQTPVVDVRRREPGFTFTPQRPYPCSGDDIYCIEEEWSFF